MMNGSYSVMSISKASTTARPAKTPSKAQHHDRDRATAGSRSSREVGQAGGQEQYDQPTALAHDPENDDRGARPADGMDRALLAAARKTACDISPRDASSSTP